MRQALKDSSIHVIKKLYNIDGLTMVDIALRFNVSTDAVLFLMRKHGVKRRNCLEVQQRRFIKSKPSFIKNKINTSKLKELAAIGAMLYWGEGSKGSIENPASTVDFANSDPNMIAVFMKFLRSIYSLDEKKFRIYLYCYANQDVSELIDFWSKISAIPSNQFSKPYVRTDFKEVGRKMKYGLIHIRYNDKKMLLDIKNMIDCYIRSYAPIE